MTLPPVPSRMLSRTQLARRAFDRSCAQLRADADAGRISHGAALERFCSLRDAYYQRKEDLRFAPLFVRSASMAKEFDRKWAQEYTLDGVAL